MANLLARLGGTNRFAADDWFQNSYLPSQFSFNGHQYGFNLNQTYDNRPIERAAASFSGYSQAVRGCPPAFAAQMVRALVLSQARFTWRNLPFASGSTPRKLFGNTALQLLEHPWTNATTGELLARMEWHAGLAGNAYVARYGNRLKVLRPDWVAILYGSDLEPDDAQHALDGEVVAYLYQQGGVSSHNANRLHTLLPQDVAHWSPIPDPEAAGIGMAWLTPAIREIQGDKAATEHKLRFFQNGATPNLVVKGLPSVDEEQFRSLVDMLEGSHAGVANAYRTLYLTEGADATVVGSNLQQMDFKATQGAGETRIAVLSRVPASLLGISEGMAGSTLNAGNFSSAKRSFADTWVYPSLQDVCAALAPLVNVPQGAELWFDVTDVPLLREDAKDAAEIEAVKASTIRQYIEAGFTAESAVAAVQGQNPTLLKHTGLVSVQLQEPGAQTKEAGGFAPPAPGSA